MLKRLLAALAALVSAHPRRVALLVLILSCCSAVSTTADCWSVELAATALASVVPSAVLTTVVCGVCGDDIMLSRRPTR